MIKWYEEHGKNEPAKDHWRDKLPEIAEHTSVTERRGIDTEREVDSMKKAEYMEDHVGETFDGRRKFSNEVWFVRRIAKYS